MTRHEITVDLPLENGEILRGARIVFHQSEARGGKTIWICHALTANSNPEDWWPELVGPGKTIDTLRDRVVCVNMLGSAYGTEGPARINPESAKPDQQDDGRGGTEQPLENAAPKKTDPGMVFLFHFPLYLRRPLAVPSYPSVSGS